MLWEEGFAPDEESEDEDAYDDRLTEDSGKTCLAKMMMRMTLMAFSEQGLCFLTKRLFQEPPNKTKVNDQLQNCAFIVFQNVLRAVKYKIYKYQ